MVEKANVLLDECNTELLGRALDGIVVLATGRCSDVFDTRTSGAEDVVDEWELQM